MKNIIALVLTAGLLLSCSFNSNDGEPQQDKETITQEQPQETQKPEIQTPATVLGVKNNRLVDIYGKPVVVRGYEMTMILWFETPGSIAENIEMTLDTMTDNMIATGANAVRFLFPAGLRDGLTLEKIDHYIGKMATNHVIVYLSIFGERRSELDADGNSVEYDYYDSPAFFGNPDIKKILDKYSQWLVLDASQECDFDDRERWERVSKEKIKEFRSYGYTCPLTVMSNTYGRDLPALLSERAQRIVDSDPLKAIIFGWQAYWGDYTNRDTGDTSNWYEYYYQMSLEEGIRQASIAPYPIQIGLDYLADAESYVDYRSAMKVAEETGMGWLWWNWYPVWGGNNLSNDGSLESLTDFGREVIYTDENSVQNTAIKAN